MHIVAQIPLEFSHISHIVTIPEFLLDIRDEKIKRSYGSSYGSFSFGEVTNLVSIIF